MVQLFITMTGKGYERGATYRVFNTETLNFDSMEDAKTYLQEQYGKCKRSPMYSNKRINKSENEKVGYIYGFRGSDSSHYPVEKWLQQDWVEFRQVKIGF